MSHDFSKMPHTGLYVGDCNINHYYQCAKCGLIGYLLDTDRVIISVRSQLPFRWVHEYADTITCDEYQIASVIL